MKQVNLGNSDVFASSVVMGCMRIAEMEIQQVERLLGTALDCGITMFDHADIYGGGQSERVFAKALSLSSADREKILLQSKCGIRDGFFDFSKRHIETATNGILERLNTEYLDMLLLHRPDALMEPEEVAAAFDALYQAGKVRYFGVSNMHPAQIELLQNALSEELIVNQLQFGPAHTGIIDAGLNVNMKVSGAADRDGHIVEYCRLNDITIQAWSPFQHGIFEGAFLESDKYAELNATIGKLAAKYNVPPSGLVVAWIARHPANIQTIVGTTNPERLAIMCKGAELNLTREEWYHIYTAAGNVLP